MSPMKNSEAGPTMSAERPQWLCIVSHLISGPQRLGRHCQTPEEVPLKQMVIAISLCHSYIIHTSEVQIVQLSVSPLGPAMHRM